MSLYLTLKIFALFTFFVFLSAKKVTTEEYFVNFVYRVGHAPDGAKGAQIYISLTNGV